MDNTFAKNSKHNAEKMKEEQRNMKQGLTTRLNAYKERIGKLCDRLEDLTEDLSVLYDDVSEEAAKQGFVKVQSAGAQKKVSQIAEELRKQGVPGFEPMKEKPVGNDFRSLLSKIRNMEQKNSAEVTYYLVVNDDLVLPIDVITEEDDDEY